jgi:hypothetical protein
MSPWWGLSGREMTIEWDEIDEAETDELVRPMDERQAEREAKYKGLKIRRHIALIKARMHRREQLWILKAKQQK